MFLLIEFVLCILVVLTAFLAPNLGGTLFSRIERQLNRLARRRGWLSVFTVGVTALVLRAAVLPVEPIPQPQFHDEFSYLLMGDTFAHGRLANPTHPMWVHFETFHVNQKPRYASMFYPAQGIFLAVGQVLFGHPFWGVWLSVGIMCAAICWMLQAWLPPFWALLGGLLAAIRLATFNYWANSYWGGASAAIGGALVLGSVVRIRRQRRARDAAVLGLGLLILANSRPYEGLFFSAPAIVVLTTWLWDRRFPRKNWLLKVGLPLCTVLALGAGGMLFYFWRTTGNPFLTPYLANVHNYNPIPYFPWQHIKPTPSYDHAEMKEFYLGWWRERYNRARVHPLPLVLTKGASLWGFYLGPVLFLPLLMSASNLPYGIGYGDLGPRMRLLMFVVLSTIAGLCLPVVMYVHYAAPLTSAIYLLVMLSMQSLRRWKWHGRRMGLAIVRSTVAICALVFVLQVGALSLHIVGPGEASIWFSAGSGIPGRAAVLSELAGHSGKLLVLVRYHVPRDPDHVPFGWVNNGADIDDSKIVWAHDMGPEKNQELLDYFRGREVWLVEPDEEPIRLSRYPAAANEHALGSLVQH